MIYEELEQSCICLYCNAFNYACFAVIHGSSAYIQACTDYGLYNTVHIAIQDCKFQSG